MGSIKVDYLIARSHKGKNRYYWNPNKFYMVNGVRTKCPWQLTRLSDDPIIAANEAEEKNNALTVWRAGDEREIIQEGYVRWLVTQYKKSSRFKELAPNTQKLYMWIFPELDVFHRVPANKITRKMGLELYEKLMTAGHTRKPSQVMQVARVVFQFGEDYGHITLNPFTHLGISKAKARQVIVPYDMIPIAKAKAIELGLPSVATAIQLGFDAGQRPGDIRRLPLSRYNGQRLRVKQSKTGAIVDIPVYKYPDLKNELDNIKHDSTLIIYEERTQKAYSKDMLCRRVREVFDAIPGGKDIQFRDLRRTAFVRMIEAGCSVPETCATTGHSISEGNDIVKVYCPLTPTMADNAADKVSVFNSTPVTRSLP